ncbi:DEAD/DEAH box helicase [Dermatophilaceae bacterium Soc4.6]
MSNYPTSGAPKKARWSTDKKAAVAGARKPHRGQGAPSASSPSDRFSRPERGARPDRPERGARPDRGASVAGAPRREWAPRSDRPDRGTDGPRREWAPRNDRPDRTDRPAARGTDGPRREWAPRSDRPQRSDRPARSFDGPRREWTPRPDRGERPDRTGRPEARLTDGPRREWTPRPDRAERADRTDRSPRGDRPQRTDRPARSFDGPRREWAPRDSRVAREPAGGRFERTDGGQGAEAERIEADTWTKSTRTSVSDGPVDVAADNGFSALGLPERLVERLARDGITTPFPIQVATIPDALAGRDVLGRGQTGSGKTLAFGLPTLTRLAQDGPRSAPRRPRALILVPTRELAMQVSDALEPLVHVVGLTHKLVAGGLSYTTQINALNRGVDLLIATPGRLNDLIERGAVELRDLQTVILDEADHMAEMGFLPEISSILDALPAGGQRLLFSATLDRGIDTLVENYLTDPVTHSTDDAKASVTTMEHHVLLIDPQHKKVITAEVANREGRTVIFVRTKLGADRVAEQLREQGVMAAALHGGLNQGARNRVLGAFRDGSLPVLVATDVAARGIHVDDISVVLQVDPPADHKDYLHRSGRTARAGEKGKVVTLALPHQRKGMERQLRDAGVDAVPTRAVPGDATLAATGATTPSGIPVSPDAFRRLLDGPPKRRTGGARPAGRGYRPQHGAGSSRPERGDRSGDRRRYDRQG